ncbi:ABC transporter ATP-binding protein [Paenibacillus turpanensis]|uniref:ABC transporter ATP-binding protein n=1 Tax=Paenibacillus turpanensis TaxID=2689078 RepID=UPI00140A79A0|nr:ABC transporter ATP-binding protein [Paenibacillus turpanensis]
MIELTSLTKQYGEHRAVDGLDLTIQKGEIFGLLGPNGAGKSTTILMMLGLTEPTSGSVTVCGIDSTRNPIRVKQKVGYLPDDIGFYDDRSGRENLMLTAQLNRIPKKEAELRAVELLQRVGLEHAGEKRVGTYSRGMRQRLGLADVLIKQPDVIILDEPTLGIDPEGVREFMDLIRTLSRKEGLTVLLSSHHLHQVQQVCDRVGLFVGGRLLACGDVDSLSRQLFSGEPYAIDVEAEPFSEELFALLKEMDGVCSAKRLDERRAEFGCQLDVSGLIARKVVETGAELRQLSRKQYGLDEIYRRYFESEVDRHGFSV